MGVKVNNAPNNVCVHHIPVDVGGGQYFGN